MILGIDAMGGRVAVQGWTETGTETAVELARRFAEDRPAALVYTDIARDGMEVGVNVEGTRALAESAGIPVIASGGVSGITDVERLMGIEEWGVFAVITGKALYTGALSTRRLSRSRRAARRVDHRRIGAEGLPRSPDRLPDRGGRGYGRLYIL